MKMPDEVWMARSPLAERQRLGFVRAKLRLFKHCAAVRLLIRRHQPCSLVLRAEEIKGYACDETAVGVGLVNEQPFFVLPRVAMVRICRLADVVLGGVGVLAACCAPWNVRRISFNSVVDVLA